MVAHTSPHILITRLSHLGDCIQTVPLLNALRDAFPKAHITWIAEPLGAQVLQDHHSLDELMIVPKRVLRSIPAVLHWRQRLQSKAFDIALDPQGLTKSALLGWLSGAPTRIGFARPNGRELSPQLNNVLVQSSAENVVDRYLELLQPLSAPTPKVRFDLKVAQRASPWVSQSTTRRLPTDQYVVMNASAGWASRMWSPERFAQVAQVLARKWNLTSVVPWAGAAERIVAEQIVAVSDGAAQLAPPTSIAQLAAILEQARLYVGTDSGPLHLAVAMGTRCVSLHGTTLAAKSGPYGHGHKAVQAYYQHGSSTRRRRATNKAMQAISVDMVCAACDDVLQESAWQPPVKRAA